MAVVERFHICTRDREKNQKNVVRLKLKYFPQRDFDVAQMWTHSSCLGPLHDHGWYYHLPFLVMSMLLMYIVYNSWQFNGKHIFSTCNWSLSWFLSVIVLRLPFLLFSILAYISNFLVPSREWKCWIGRIVFNKIERKSVVNFFWMKITPICMLL